MVWHIYDMGGGVWTYLLLLFFIIVVAGIFVVIWTLKHPAEEEFPTETLKKKFQKNRAIKLVTIPRIIANVVQLTFSIILVILSLHLIHLAIGHILHSFEVEEVVEQIFSAIWLITVALAVFDLAGIIFDEIVWGGTKKELKEFQWQFIKFLIVIINALLLESLVVFFRVEKKDVTMLMYPALSLLSVCILIVSLAFYIKSNRSANNDEEENRIEILKTRYAKGEIGKAEFLETKELIK